MTTEKRISTSELKEETLLVHEPIIDNKDGTISFEARIIVTFKDGKHYDGVKRIRLSLVRDEKEETKENE